MEYDNDPHLRTEHAPLRAHHIHSDPRIHPTWADDNDAELDNVVNGWNPSLEEWMDEIQRDSAQLYCMLLHQADHLRILKWIFLIVYGILAFAGAVMTSIVAILDLDDVLWLLITIAVILALGPLVMFINESAGFSSDIQACKDVGGDSNVLGLRIEAQKRQTRRHRQEGMRFSNAASIRFEELRKDAPRVFGYIKKKYQMGTDRRSVAGFNIPSAVLGLREDEDVMEGEEIPEEIVNDEYFADTQLQHHFDMARSARTTSLPPMNSPSLSQVVVEGETSSVATEIPAKGKEEENHQDVAAPPARPRERVGSISSGVGIQNLFQNRLRLLEAEKTRELDVSAYEDYVRGQFYQGRKGAASSGNKTPRPLGSSEPAPSSRKKSNVWSPRSTLSRQQTRSFQLSSSSHTHNTPSATDTASRPRTRRQGSRRASKTPKTSASDNGKSDSK